MADNDIRGQFRRLVRILLSPTWGEVWEGLGIPIETFETLGLARNAPDALIWQTCQARQVVLVTGNRKGEGPDSLEVTIRSQNTPDSLPVITLSSPRRILKDRRYAEGVAEKLLECLLEIDIRRGAGRIWVP
jgi:hypothetical protein